MINFNNIVCKYRYSTTHNILENGLEIGSTLCYSNMEELEEHLTKLRSNYYHVKYEIIDYVGNMKINNYSNVILQEVFGID